MTNFEKALEHLRLMAKKLESYQGRITRRNARRKVFGAMRRVHLAMNAEFPQIGKPKPEKPKKPKKSPKLKLPFRKRCKIKEIELFVEVVSACWDRRPLPTVFYHKHINGLFQGVIYLNGEHTDTQNWLTLINSLAKWLGTSAGEPQRQREEQLIELWARFWKEVIPHDDLEVVAKHQAFLETLQ